MNRPVRLGWMTVLIVSLAALVMTSCRKEGERPGSPTSTETTPVADKLPAEFYGVWQFEGSSGGFSGRGNASYDVEKIVIAENNVIEEYRPGGTRTRDSFIPSRGKSIFSTNDVWRIQRKKSSMVEVLTLSTNGRLSISENVYDGFSYSYKKAEESSATR